MGAHEGLSWLCLCISELSPGVKWILKQICRGKTKQHFVPGAAEPRSWGAHWYFRDGQGSTALPIRSVCNPCVIWDGKGTINSQVRQGRGDKCLRCWGFTSAPPCTPHAQPTVLIWVLLQKSLLRAGCLHVNDLSFETEFLLLKWFHSLCTAQNCTDQLKHLKQAERENRATKELSRNFCRQQHLN